jgi:hypothetical protein
MVLLATLLILIPVIPASGDFSEDFSDPELDGWILFDTYSTTTGTTSSWSVQNGSLMPTGNLNSYNDHNFACHDTDVNPRSSIWSFDMFGPSERWRLGFRVSLLPPLRDDGFYTLFLPHFQVVVSAGLDANGNPSALQIGLVQFTDESSFQLLDDVEPEDELIRGRHTYRIEREDSDVTVYADDQLLLKAKLDEMETTDYDAICLWSERGSGVKVDNITAVEVNPRSDDSSLGTSITPITLGIVAIVTTRYFMMNYKKKFACI